MLINMIKTFTSIRGVVNYITKNRKEYDLIFYLAFAAQTFILPSMPSMPNSDSWTGFYIGLGFTLLFYPCFYFLFYKMKDSDFIREVIVLSVVSRLLSFLLVGGLALLWIFFLRAFEIFHKSKGSLVWYLLYCFVYTALMIYMRRKIQSNTTVNQ